MANQTLKEICMNQILKIKDTILEDEIINEIKKQIRLEYEEKIKEIPHIVYCMIHGFISDENLYDKDMIILSKQIVSSINLEIHNN